jgi:Domain of unknown function (DUF4177)
LTPTSVAAEQAPALMEDLHGRLAIPHYMLLVVAGNDRAVTFYQGHGLTIGREKYTGRRLSGDRLEAVLNEHAAQGWQLKFLTRAGGGGLDSLRIFIMFERQIGLLGMLKK